MEYITKEAVIGFIKSHKLTLSSTHAKLCFPITRRLYKKMRLGIKFAPISVHESLIIDGHHQYIATLLAGIAVEYVLGCSTAATTITPWNGVLFQDEDWDTPAKIKLLNKQDAHYNNITIKKLVELVE